MEPTVQIRIPELIKLVAAESGLSQKVVKECLNTTIEHMTDSLANGTTIILHNFGKFSVADCKERQGRNPATGEPMTLPAHKAVRFKPSEVLNAKLN